MTTIAAEPMQASRGAAGEAEDEAPPRAEGAGDGRAAADRESRAEKPAPCEAGARNRAAKTPATGAEIKSGTANVATGGAQVPFGGLATGGGGTGGATVDVADFCCPDYLRQHDAPDPAELEPEPGAAGTVQMKFAIAATARSPTSRSRSRAASRCSTWRRSGRCSTRGNCRRCRRAFPDGPLTVHSISNTSADEQTSDSLVPAPPSAACATLARRPRQSPQQPPAAAAAATVTEVINGIARGCRAEVLAVPGFIALSPDAETVAAAKTISEVLWDDIAYEREFYLIPRDTYRDHPAAGVARQRAARPMEAS